MRFIFFIAIILSFNTCFTQGLINMPADTALPRSWQNMEFLERVGQSQVMLWVQKKDERPFELRSCITLMTSFDSIGNTEYWIEEIYANDSKFREWNIASIHYGPSYNKERGGDYIGFWDLHLEKFEHKPSKKEIEDLLEQWHFCVFQEGWTVVNFGLNRQAWIEILGFVPDLNRQEK